MIIDKNTDYKQVIKDFPIHWSLDRVAGLQKIIENCKDNEKWELILDKKRTYKLERIKMYKSRLERLKILLLKYKEWQEDSDDGLVSLALIYRRFNQNSKRRIK